MTRHVSHVSTLEAKCIPPIYILVPDNVSHLATGTGFKPDHQILPFLVTLPGRAYSLIN